MPHAPARRALLIATLALALAALATPPADAADPPPYSRLLGRAILPAHTFAPVETPDDSEFIVIKLAERLWGVE